LTGNHSPLLYVVATPIGNLGDISLRAIDVLKTVDIVAAEDTRHTAHLLAHLGIQKPMMAVHEHNELKSAQIILEKIRSGQSIALVTDAGTPGISDPGARVVRACYEGGIKVVPIPGASAVITALSASGILESGFLFYGFLPATASQRQKVLEALKEIPFTLVFYEAPHRILPAIDSLSLCLGAHRHVTLARELTKTFETIYQSTLGELKEWLFADPNQQKGEFVIIVGADMAKDDDAIPVDAKEILHCLLKELSLKQAVKIATEITGIKKNLLYDYALTIQQKK
jgi:16S rRNA (cytidine1402-2'-O)-methyltransferase